MLRSTEGCTRIACVLDKKGRLVSVWDDLVWERVPWYVRFWYEFKLFLTGRGLDKFYVVEFFREDASRIDKRYRTEIV